MTYEQLLSTADQAGLTVKERPLQKHDGLIRGNRIAIRKSIDTQAEKSCVLAEELGHHYTTTGNASACFPIRNFFCSGVRHLM